MEYRSSRKPRLAEIMDNIIFDWVDEIPNPMRGKGRSTGKWEALLDMLKSKPDHIIRLEMFFEMNMQYIATSFRKYVKNNYPDESVHVDMASRKEGVTADGKPVYVLYAAYYAEPLDDE
jgi:hypothetical protein